MPSDEPNRSAAPETGYTVLVVPQHGPTVHRMSLGAVHVQLLERLARLSPTSLRRLLSVSASLALVLVATLAALAWHYASVVGRAEENTQLREENEELKNQLARIKERVAHINDTLARVKHLNANLQNITQLQDPDRKLAITADEPSDEELRAELDPAALGDSLDQLAAEAQSQEETLRALTGYFEDRQALLASAPSIWPARGWVTSDFGYRLDPYTAARKQHAGIDIANAIGTPIVAPANGTVIYASYENGYGNVLVLDHGSGIKTRYAHLSKIHVRMGDRVKRGQLIAALGNTGRSTGPHLHYEVRINGTPENPRKFILEQTAPGDPFRGYLSAGARREPRAMGGSD